MKILSNSVKTTKNHTHFIEYFRDNAKITQIVIFLKF